MRATIKVTRTFGQALTALGIIIAALNASAATLRVNATCSLQDAMHSANTDSSVGGCGAGGGADTIVLQANSTIVLTSADNDWLGGTGLPLVTSDITIEGRGSTITRDASAPDFRIFGVEFANLTLNETTVSGGVAAGTPFEAAGGGIRGNYGILELNDCVITGNSASDRGSALSILGNEVTVNRTSIAGNSGPEAVFSLFGIFEFNQSAIILNEGDGLSVIAAPTTLNDCTVSSNGGVGLDGYWFLVHRSTITGNGGAGVATYYVPPSFTQSIISGNHGAAASGREISWDSNYGFLPDTEFNIFGFSDDAGVVGFTPAPTDIVPTGSLRSILNPALAANGGPTLTHLIRSTSPARDAAPACSGVDQRMVSRPQATSCDIGAVELVADPCPTATASFGCTVNGVTNQLCVGGTGNDIIVGTSGDDVIFARAGSDTVWGAAGNDIICGGAGGDVLHGGSGDDVVVGGNGADSVWGDQGHDSLDGGEGVDVCSSDASDVSTVSCN